MSDPIPFQGTPDDWWEMAEPLMVSEAEYGRQIGNWYIIKINSSGKTRHSYRLSTPSKPPNLDEVMKAQGPHDRISDRVKLLIRGEVPIPAWRTAHLVIADTGVIYDDGTRGVERHPWIRKNHRWRSLYNGTFNINDHSMSELNPTVAKIIEEE